MPHYKAGLHTNTQIRQLARHYRPGVLRVWLVQRTAESRPWIQQAGRWTSWCNHRVHAEWCLYDWPSAWYLASESEVSLLQDLPPPHLDLHTQYTYTTTTTITTTTTMTTTTTSHVCLCPAPLIPLLGFSRVTNSLLTYLRRSIYTYTTTTTSDLHTTHDSKNVTSTTPVFSRSYCSYSMICYCHHTVSVCPSDCVWSVLWLNDTSYSNSVWTS